MLVNIPAPILLSNPLPPHVPADLASTRSASPSEAVKPVLLSLMSYLKPILSDPKNLGSLGLKVGFMCRAGYRVEV